MESNRVCLFVGSQMRVDMLYVNTLKARLHALSELIKIISQEVEVELRTFAHCVFRLRSVWRNSPGSNVVNLC